MQIFRTKNKQGSEENDTDEHGPVAEEGLEEVRPSPRKKIKPNERLDSVISESVVASALEVLRENARFQLSPQAWVILVVSSEALGGLGKKHSGNEAKGSIIEHIEQDQIQVLATDSMLGEEVFGIIPTKETLQVMDEYSLLTNANFVWSVVELTDDGGLTVKPTNNGGTYFNKNNPDAIRPDGGYKEAVAIVEGTLLLRTVLPSLWDWSAEDREDESEAPEEAAAPAEDIDVADGDSTEVMAVTPDESDDEDPMSGAAEGAPGDDEGVDYSQLDDEADDEAEDDDAEGEEFIEDELAPTESAQDESSADADEDDEEGVDQAYLDYVEENQDRVVREEEVRATIARRFLSDDLHLEIDLEEFNTTFDVDAPAVEFPVAQDSTDWLGSQVVQLANQANAELQKLHRDHTDELRESYVNLMSKHTEEVLDKVSMVKGDTVYVKMTAAADAEYDQALRSVDDLASTQRNEITARFEAQSEERAQQAAANARSEFTNRNRPQYEQNLAEVGTVLQRRTEEAREYRRQETLQYRTSQARKLMDLGSNRALKILSERQMEQRDLEMQTIRAWSDEMSRFIDENRKNDLARASTLASQLEKDTQIAELREEQRARVESLGAERDLSIQRLRVELANDHEEAQRKLNSREIQLQSQIEAERTRAEASQATVISLTRELDQADARASRVFHEEIKQLKTANDLKVAELDQAHQGNKRQNTYLALVALVFVLAAAGVGLVFGWAVALNPEEPLPEPESAVEIELPADDASVQ